MKVKIIVETLKVKSLNKTFVKNEVVDLPEESSAAAIKCGYAIKVVDKAIKEEIKETPEPPKETAKDKVEFAVKEEKTTKAVKKTSKNKK